MNDAVKRILTSRDLSPDDFEQHQVIELIKNPLSDVWTTVYAHSDEVYGSPAIFCCLAELEHRADILDGSDWLKHADSFTPGFCISAGSTRFEPSCHDAFHFIIMEQYFHSLNEAQLHLNQEFALIFELYRASDGNYYSIDECGGRELVVEFSDHWVKVKTKYLLRYMCARQLLFVQFIDSRVSTPGRYPFHTDLFDSDSEVGANYRFDRWYQGNESEGYLLSMIYARSFVEPGPVEDCGLWPYDEEDEKYPQFIISELPDGSYERFTCDESKLANYFGANPDAPHYLTPVYFKPSVLDKYRRDKHYDVSERRLSCGSQWGIEIDNVIPSRVMVFLGDLGRDLPESERSHFLAFEMSPIDQRISEEVIANDFFNCWVDSKGPIGNLLNAREELDDKWRASFGVPLYRPLHKDESDIAKGIRVPTSSGREEFDTVILNLAKTMVDYIDESQFSYPDVNGSINKLEAFLIDNDIDVDLSPLRDLQSLRSASVAHSKGKNYDKLVGNIITGDNASDAQSLIERLTSLMDSLAKAIR